MKRKTAAIASFILAGSMAALMCGCSLFGSNADSSFPYTAAVAGGYSGSEASYMADQDIPSTRERQLYAEAVESGYAGTYVDFLKQLNTAEPDDSLAVNAALTSVVCIEAAFSSSTMSGSGVIYSLDKSAGDAYVITNYHVIYGSRVSTDIKIYLYGTGEPISASFYGGAMSYDIAVLKVTGSQVLKKSSATAAKVADSDSVTLGERVYALGNPNGDGFSVTGGVVSVTAEYVSVAQADNRDTLSLLEIRTDAAVNHGNSGGGLFNARGELVGIVNARSEEEGVYGFGYAIPVNLAMPLVENILDHKGSAAVARIGITAGATVADSKGVYDETTGKYYIEEKVIVKSVETSSAGFSILKRGDTLISATLKGKTVQITRLHILTNLLFEVRQGDTLTLTVSRDDAPVTLTLNFNKSNYFTSIK